MLGKISRLPRDLRDQLHYRLDDGQSENEILPWLNSLPQVQDLLKQFFKGEPISPTNLTQYRQRGFRRWKILQSASEFLSEDSNDSSPLAGLSSGPLIDRLVHWISIRFAAAAHNCPAADDPQNELSDIRALLADIVSLRRGELVSRRIALEQQRLERENTKSQHQLEQLFWEWTKRPDISASLFPHRDPDKLRRDVLSILDHQLLGAQNPFPLDLEPDPACAI